jgi:hypothetical protein
MTNVLRLFFSGVVVIAIGVLLIPVPTFSSYRMTTGRTLH